MLFLLINLVSRNGTLLFSSSFSIVNLMWGSWLLKTSRISTSALFGMIQMISSTYFLSRGTLKDNLGMQDFSNSSITYCEIIGEIVAPIGVPKICLYTLSSKMKKVELKTNFIISMNLDLGMLVTSLMLSHLLLIAPIAAPSNMFVNKKTTSRLIII